jgi:thioesterase domain-containing protein
MVQEQFGQESGLTVAAVEDWLAREIAAELDLHTPIPRDAQLSSYQIDSVTAAAILGSLSQWIGWPVPPYMLFDQPTIASIADLVMSSRQADSRKAKVASPYSSLLIALNAPDPPPPIFLIGGLMGAVLYLRELADAFPSHQKVFALRAAGLDSKESPFETVAAAADVYLSVIRAAFPHGPYRLAGHSFGGLVAYEMAARLREFGESVQLVLLDTLLFGQGEPHDLPSDDMALVELLAAIRLHQQPEVIPNVETLAQLSPDVMRDEVIAAIAGSRPFAGDVSLNRWVKVYRAHSAAMRDFQPKVVPDLPYLLVKAESGYPHVLMHPARKRYACYDNPLLGWDALSALPRVTTVPGNHYTLVFGRNASTTASTVMQYFEKAQPLSRVARR